MANEKNYRIETDLLGELKVPAEALYGVQTQRGINNYHISRKTMRDYPDFIIILYISFKLSCLLPLISLSDTLFRPLHLRQSRYSTNIICKIINII